MSRTVSSDDSWMPVARLERGSRAPGVLLNSDLAISPAASRLDELQAPRNRSRDGASVGPPVVAWRTTALPLVLGTRHSTVQNLAARPEVALAIYDPSAAVGAAAAVYISGTAEELTGAELERGIEIFDRLSRTNDGPGWQLSDVQPPSQHRLYRATAEEHFVLIRGRDPERGTGVDRRERVELP